MCLFSYSSDEITGTVKGFDVDIVNEGQLYYMYILISAFWVGLNYLLWQFLGEGVVSHIDMVSVYVPAFWGAFLRILV